jgi:mono/diheme cytochrome c family protein/cytochrome c5
VPRESSLPIGAHPSRIEGWQGISLVAITYVYFLIFAQFGFLKRLTELGITQAALPLVMGAMAVGGVAMSLLPPRSRLLNCPSRRLQTGFLGCALTAGWSLLPLNTGTAAFVAGGIGLSLGLLTVTLVANLQLWIGSNRPLVKIGLGTGLGYFVCNVPALFTAAPRWIAISSGLCCVAGAVIANRTGIPCLPARGVPESQKSREVPFALVVAWFTALVWLDSAAFFIIQNSPSLRAEAWHGSPNLWRTAIVHLVAAVFSGWLLSRRGLSGTLALGFTALGGACLLLPDPLRGAIAAFLYPTGVSLYSVALVAYPSFLMDPGKPELRARRAGSLYAIAGWVGSALGIGMGRDLHRVPPAFVALAAALLVVAWFLDASAAGTITKSVEIQALAIVMVVALAFGVTLVVRPTIRPFGNVPAENAVERGRRVYIAEGCINCHSQYVRPNTADAAMWGPVSDIDSLKREQPPLIGNRRQGPDLSQVGARRSPLWLRMHFMQPRDVSYRSPMPSYDYLFRSGRGEDLIAYLSRLNSPGHWAGVGGWQLSLAAWKDAGSQDGALLFRQHCATCHAPGGTARMKWSKSFRRLPPDLALDPLKHVSIVDSQVTRAEVARITKFGIEGTDMAGHEYLPDGQIAAIADYVSQQRQSGGKLAER